MSNQFSGKNLSSKKPSRLYLVIPLTFLIVYAAYLVGQSAWQHYQINRELDTLTEEITNLEDQSKKLELAISYYDSDSFREKEARSKLGYQKKGETAIALPPSEDEIKDQETEENPLSINQQTFTQPNYIRWWSFFFKGE